MAELFKIIERQMKVLDLSKTEIAAAVGVSQRMIEFYLQGTKQPSFKNLVKLSQVLKFDMNELSEPKVREVAKKENTYQQYIKSGSAEEPSEEYLTALEYKEKYLEYKDKYLTLKEQISKNQKNSEKPEQPLKRAK